MDKGGITGGRKGWMLTSEKIKEGKKEVLYSELSSLLSSGLDFSRSFRLLIDGESDKKMKAVLVQIYASVVQGHTLWESFRISGGFTPLDYGVLRIGEETGRMNESLLFLSGYYCKRIEQRRMISNAVSYPVVILFTAVAVLIFMLAVVVPMFEQVYARMGGDLPALTRSMIALSRKFPCYLIFGTVICVVLGVLYFIYRNKESVRSVLAYVILRMPYIGRLVRKNYQARFCKLLYLLYSSGIPLLQAIGMLKDIISCYPYQCSFDGMMQGLKRGELFADNLAAFPLIYSRKLVTLLRVGEETNRLGDMFFRQGEELTKELEHDLKQLGSLLEPILILCIGGLVALVLISMYLPMFKLGGIVH